ncbi:hypothetical protein ZIOFF_055610 [Zingiber officinale]|uniref:Uncharacterized protein n=1 Tax=Zingiber officinale TaxID=94328 RepID=A0A8J5FFA7_ZINOF|nr:hypothetical protein ZIOFF_055610 [Zingiber officinale]
MYAELPPFPILSLYDDTSTIHSHYDTAPFFSSDDTPTDPPLFSFSPSAVSFTPQSPEDCRLPCPSLPSSIIALSPLLCPARKKKARISSAPLLWAFGIHYSSQSTTSPNAYHHPSAERSRRSPTLAAAVSIFSHNQNAFFGRFWI